MKHSVYYIYALVFFSFPALSNNSLLNTVNEHNKFFHKKYISAVGQHVLLPNQTLNDAYLLAEKMAKVIVAKKYGSYFEQVEMKDTVTGEIKKTINSVNAAILKYEVINKRTELLNGEVIAVIEIKAKYEPVELKQAMDRFYENSKIKEEVLKISKQLDDVNRELYEKDELVRQLRELNQTVDGSLVLSQEQDVEHKKEVTRLKKLLADKNTNVAKKVVIFDRTIASLRESVTHFNGDSMLSQAKKLVMDAAALEDNYMRL